MTKAKLDSLVEKIVKQDSGKNKPYGFWKDRLQVLFEARDIMQEHGFSSLPSDNKLRSLGHNGITHAIRKYHGGFPAFREMLGEDQKKIETGLWNDREYCLAEARKLMEKYDWETLPSSGELNKNGYSSLSVAISKYHGGFHKFRKLLGEEQKMVEAGLWKDLEYCIAKVMVVMKEHGFERVPSKKEFEELGFGNISTAISRHHGGMRKFRQLLGEEQLLREDGQWADSQYALSEARKVMEEQGVDKLPPSPKLRAVGYSALANAISTYHGGFATFRNLLGEPAKKRRRNGVWRDLDYCVEEARMILDEYGLEQLPSEKKLNNLGYRAFVRAVAKYHGGLPAFRQLMEEHTSDPIHSMGSLVASLVEDVNE